MTGRDSSSSNARQAFDEVLRCLGNSPLEQALALCRSELRAWPDDASLTALLGAILLKSGATGDAEKHLVRAIELAPEFAKPYEDLGALYLGQDDVQRSIPCFEKALLLDDGLAMAARGLAVALERCGRNEDAETIRGRFLPGAAVSHGLVQARRHYEAGSADKAREACEEILRKEPGHIASLHLMALIATDEERHNDAEALLRRIVELAPGSTNAISDLARFLGQQGRYEEAIELLQTAASPDDAGLQLVLGDMLGIVGRPADALVAYQACLVQKPNEAPALLGSAHMLRILGDSAGAMNAYQQCIVDWPDLGDARWYLASMGRNEATDDDVSAMLAQLDRAGTHADSRVAFCFALARAYEQRKRFDDAWAYYRRGNEEKRQLVKYDPVKTEVAVRKNKTVFTKDYLSGAPVLTPKGKTPIFIVGVPRSGSTLIEQVLASHSQVTGCGELPYVIMISAALAARRGDGVDYPEVMRDLDVSELTGLGRSYLYHAESHDAHRLPYFTDKMPANFTHVGFIHKILPQAKIIDARRHPVATCVANYRQLFAKGKNQSYDLTELGEYYLQYIDMMNHWDDVMPGVVLRVQYEDVITDTESQVRRMLEHCGLPFEPACVEFHKSERPVNTASSEQVRRPIYRSGIDYWKNYESWLGELQEVLAPVLG